MQSPRSSHRSRESGAASAAGPAGQLAVVRDALVENQRAARAVLDAMPSLKGTRPVDLVDGLGIDLKLAWKVARIAQSGDPFESVRHLPGPEGWRIWLAAAGARGVRRALLARAEAAFDQALEQGIRWAGSRQAFSSLAMGAAQSGDTRVSLEQRRQFYQAASHLWGMRAAFGFRVDVLAPSADGASIDCATVRAYIDLERLHVGAAWRFEAPIIIDDQGLHRTAPAVERIDSGDRRRHPPFLLKRFCSDPLPELTPIEVGGGRRGLALGEGPVGPESRATIVHGAIIRAMQPIGVTDTDHGIFQVHRQRTAVEERAFDLIVHRDLMSAEAQPEAILYSDLWRGPEQAAAHSPRDRLPFTLNVVEFLAKPGQPAVLRAGRLKAWARYSELLSTIFERTGWRSDEFRFFRASIDYPPIPSSIALELPFGEWNRGQEQTTRS